VTDQEADRKDAAAMCAYTAEKMLLAASVVNRMQASVACAQDEAYWQLALALSEELALIGHALNQSNQAMMRLAGVRFTPAQRGMIQ
jgi:hypothetical protein